MNPLPRIALAGRPNVGKSALFNRIAGRRVAIVHDEAGVTRDRLELAVERDGRKFVLADAGGIAAPASERIADAMGSDVRAQALASIGASSVAVLVVDVRDGLLPLDEEVAALLHRSGTPAVVAANKSDNPSLDLAASEFAGLGFPVFPVSALHGRGVSALLEACYSRFPAPAETRETPETPQPGESEGDAAAQGGESGRPVRIALAGRPNAGKSSLLNRILGTDRAIVSDAPGTTRDPVEAGFEYGGGAFEIVDTAGVRREARVDTAVERYSRFRVQDAIESADVVVLMVDYGRGPGLLDRQLAGMCVELGKSCVVAVNKWDLARESEKSYAERVARDLPFMSHCPVVFVSAKTGLNARRLVAVCAHVAASARATLPTGPLNRCLQEACATNAAPGGGDKPFRLHYAVQTGVSPIRIRAFVNDPRRMPASFEQFLANRLREKFDLAGVSVKFQFRARERRNPDGSAKGAPAPSNLRELRAAKKSSGKTRRRRRAMPRG